jgi:hypothetical protein
MIEQESQQIQNSFYSGNCTERQWCELDAAQQAILWANDWRSTKSPFSTAMGDLFISL